MISFSCMPGFFSGSAVAANPIVGFAAAAGFTRDVTLYLRSDIPGTGDPKPPPEKVPDDDDDEYVPLIPDPPPSPDLPDPGKLPEPMFFGDSYSSSYRGLSLHTGMPMSDLMFYRWWGRASSLS